ncbi:MAG: hypothetical protein QY332_14265 [Anaerolineales bacterium]|nr:MAG: hypothetical protein QY332_14265 [Anaerolineales bacterium]
MRPRIKIGLIAGAIGLVLNACVAGLIGFCGPVVALVAGGLAGFFAARQENPPTRNEGAKTGATAGGIAGVLIIVGQVIGAIGALVYMQASGTQPIFGEIPSMDSSPSILIGYYFGGLGTGLCFGIVGALLAAGVGAGAGYMATSDQSPAEPAA